MNLYDPFGLSLHFGTRQVPELSWFDDDFESGSSVITDRGFTGLDLNLLSTNTVTSGEYRMAATVGGAGGTFWLTNNNGSMASRQISGDVDQRVRLQVYNATFTGLPALNGYQLVGIAVHDPTRPPAAGAQYNYVHVTAGVFNGAVGGYSVETKNTVNNVSTFPATSLTVVGSFLIDLRLVRVGTLISSFYRQGTADALESNSNWIGHQSFTRAAFPNTLDWGLIVYSSLASCSIGAAFRKVMYRRP